MSPPSSRVREVERRKAAIAAERDNERGIKRATGRITVGLAGFSKDRGKAISGMPGREVRQWRDDFGGPL